MIEIKNLKKTYTYLSEEFGIFNDISLVIDHGQWCSIIGPSGSGKTTFLNCVAGLTHPDEGDVLYEAINIHKIKEKTRNNYRRLNMGFIFQDFKLLPHYSVLDNVVLPLYYDEPKRNLYSRARNLLQKVGISENLFNRLPESLSGGEKQRVAIARALIANPKVLICDEPTGSLDLVNRNKIINILLELKQMGLTILLVTHDEEVANQGDVTYRLNLGKLEEVRGNKL
ncbi:MULTISPECIES: ABC transporter ATP-binding protein [unclassified Lysinibacillus]|uniref:ABC transporter ATP-binding protein n=1 Tax=unclassified Lysinibacillus TaxID=2636778 RepID=UPI002011D7E6|nr:MULTISPECIES: ABC transporter ATP-binding protein [unclassified Lysinibacillus]MCL1696797.1 ABC transporter ATP-binding protein [Lysinibacillus sp. BPa_S21]MCL1700338.1 ABC transporter ATP-binding protein [Lysinibacillus sp. Bpr_S20]